MPLKFYIKHTLIILSTVCRCTVSAQSSLPGNMVERKASPSGSRSTRLPKETVGNIQSTSTLPPAKSKSLRYMLILLWVFLLLEIMSKISPLPFVESGILLSYASLLLCFLFSQRGQTVNKRQTGRRWRNVPLKRRKSTSLLTIPLSFRRSVCSLQIFTTAWFQH